VPGELDTVGALLRRVYTRVTNEAVGEGGSSRDAVVLDVILANRGSSQQDLAERLGINRTIMVRIADRLTDAGWVTRERNPADRRSYALALTPAGEVALERLSRDVADRDRRLTAPLTRAERTRLHELLRGLLPEPATPVASTEFLVTQAYFRLRRMADGMLADVGMRMPHYGPLLALELRGPSPQREVARGLAITEPAAAELIDELVAAGLVTRDRDPADRRRYALALTPTGRDRLARIRATQAEVSSRVAELLGPDGAEELRRLLKRILATEPGRP
jgi:DNA-binding MarR family transcriptional regulator